MRSVFLGFTLALGALTAACTIDPPAGTPTPPMAGVLEPGPREARFGRTGEEVINNPQLRDKIRSLFGADWTPAAEGRGKIAKGAAAYVGRTEPPRGVRVGDANYVAVTGCVPANCGGEGGFSHYYAYGGNWGLAGTTAQIVDSARRALERSGNPYPRT